MAVAHADFQYESLEHQSDTALSGMWLFLAQEAMFFGGLFFAWMLTRHFHPIGFHRGAQQTDLLIGTANCALLLTSSFAYWAGLTLHRAGDTRGLIRFLVLTLGIGIVFVGLKSLEWHEDISKGLLPGAGFGISGIDSGGAQLFWIFYWVATGLHLVHMAIGLVLVGWIIRRAIRGDFAGGNTTPLEVVGLYWSFVDMVWIALYPLIYLVGRPG